MLCHIMDICIIYLQSSVEGVHTLLIPSIHLSDEDCYKCEAKNDYGSVTTCAHVKVQGKTATINDNLDCIFSEV